MRLREATKVVREGCAETLAYTRFPMERWRRIRTNNATERLNRESRGSVPIVGVWRLRFGGQAVGPGRESGASSRA
ncbi:MULTISPECIES: transposase [unclassified Adlercreutzia]|uniref:transposase n=1 Tax=unclassified Adlercreutzia TaxID=2636013 RepID=UPI0013ED829E